MTKDKDIDNASIIALENLRRLLILEKKRDVVKYCMPEAYKTSLVMTINARSLQNFIVLRSSKHALWEIRDLANEIYLKIPENLYNNNFNEEEKSNFITTSLGIYTLINND